METDFNGAKKQIYCIRMLSNAPKHNLMPEEIYSKCNRMVDDGTLNKVLTYNIIWQMQRPAGIAAVDTNNCYNRMVHVVASMVFQAFGMPSTVVESISHNISGNEILSLHGVWGLNGLCKLKI
jgi:hypothetical protein